MNRKEMRENEQATCVKDIVHAIGNRYTGYLLNHVPSCIKGEPLLERWYRELVGIIWCDHSEWHTREGALAQGTSPEECFQLIIFVIKKFTNHPVEMEMVMGEVLRKIIPYGIYDFKRRYNRIIIEDQKSILGGPGDEVVSDEEAEGRIAKWGEAVKCI